MKNQSQSPYDVLKGNLFFKIRSFFLNHDRYLLLALFLCFIPFPLGGMIAFVISLVAIPLYKKDLFQNDERNFILLLFPLSLINILLTSFLLLKFYKNSNDFVLSVINFIHQAILYLWQPLETII